MIAGIDLSYENFILRYRPILEHQIIFEQHNYINHMGVNIRSVVGRDALPYLRDLARLRIEVFREFPYLYDGDMDYEEAYLQSFAECPDSLMVLALDNNQVVGASTGKPLKDEHGNILQPWIDHGEDISRIFYYGESVLKKSYRGQGIGKQFFFHREQFARKLPQINKVCFCAVLREEDHPLKPKDYLPMNAFWEKQGFRKMKDYVCNISWKDIDEKEDSEKPLVFWQKNLD